MYREYDPETAASVYCIDYGKAVAALEARLKTCAICRGQFDPQGGGKQVWCGGKIQYRYICPDCWSLADDIEEEF